MPYDIPSRVSPREKKNQTNHAHTHTHTRSQGYLDVISVNSGEANKPTDGERNGDTVPVNKQHPMAISMATHTHPDTHMEQV